jgi:hypothetical protein
MIDCGNSEIRELLPDMLHDSLSPSERKRVSVHMAGCAECREEMALLSKVYSLGAAPTVNVAAIAASIAPYRKRPWFSVPAAVRIAAGIAVIAVGGASYSIVNRTVEQGDAGITESAIASLANDTVPLSATTVTDPVSVSSDLNSLDDQAVDELLSQLEKMDASISVEPRRLVRNPRVSGN